MQDYEETLKAKYINDSEAHVGQRLKTHQAKVASLAQDKMLKLEEVLQNLRKQVGFKPSS